MTFSAPDSRHMARALHLARRGLFTTQPNPRVGCVVVDGNGEQVGEGYHQRAGEPHAEVLALRQAGARARGGTAYVTLEPCSHHGRTPPCADALVNAGVGRVVAAMEDPNPEVSGRGLGRLREAGVSVSSGLLENEARALNPGFIKRMEQGLPWVRVKLASSLDGRTAMASGESMWITGEAARADVQRLRARSSAILTGVSTVLFDDPSLNVRLSSEEELVQPLRVILDSSLRTPETAKTLQLPGEVLIVHAEGQSTDREKRLRNAGAQLSLCGSANSGGLDLDEVLRVLAKREINEVHVEAGATLCGALLSAGMADELVVYMAPHIMGDGGRGLFHLPDVSAMEQRVPLTVSDIRAVGGDWRITANLASSN